MPKTEAIQPESTEAYTFFDEAILAPLGKSSFPLCENRLGSLVPAFYCASVPDAVNPLRGAPFTVSPSLSDR
jgi:hypothetical protein